MADLDGIRRRVERAMIAHARTIVPKADGFSFGAIDIDPKHLAVWITTPTDRERDRLARDPAVAARFREILAEEGYPPAAIPDVGLAFESQETVDRVFGGNWWHAVK
ncbi:hypothetical protein [Brevundimonas lenta]|nr:hypothetical protein [Brevundimonas lenta]